MLYPLRSSILAIIIFVLIVVIIGLELNKNKLSPLVSLEIDAEMIGDFNQHQHNSKPQKQSIDRPPLDDSRNSKIQHQHVDNKHHDNNKTPSEQSNNKLAQKVQILSRPLPEIPEDLRYEAFSSEIIAKFFIAKNGEVKEVKLIQPSRNPRLNFLLLKSLQKWKFTASNSETSEIINVKFTVTD